MKVLLNDYYPN